MATVHAAALRQALRPLNGLRVISAIQIMVFHYVMQRHFSPDELNAGLRARPVATNALLVGNLGLETLFLMSAFLAAITLIPALEQPRSSTRQEVLRYWYRRAFRIAPAHWVSLVVTYVFVLRDRHSAMPPEAAAIVAGYPEAVCPGGLWKQAAFLGHWRMTTTCGMQLWSQGLQAALWLCVPLVVAAARPKQAGFRRRAAMLAGGVIAIGTAYRAWTDWRHQLSWPIIIFPSADMADMLGFLNFLDLHHSPLAMRAASFAVGCLAALPFLDSSSFQPPAAKQRVTNGSSTHKQEVVAVSIMSRKTASIGTNAAAVVIAVMCAAGCFRPAGAPTWSRAAAVACLVTIAQGGILSSAAIAFLMTIMLTRAGPLGRLLHTALAAPFWQPLADLSYSAYLYHIQARFWVWRYGLLPSGLATSAEDLGGFGMDVALSIPAAFAVAYLSHRLVEQPAARLGRRLEPLLFGGPAADVKTDASTAASDKASATAGNVATAA